MFILGQFIEVLFSPTGVMERPTKLSNGHPCASSDKVEPSHLSIMPHTVLPPVHSL